MGYEEVLDKLLSELRCALISLHDSECTWLQQDTDAMARSDSCTALRLVGNDKTMGLESGHGLDPLTAKAVHEDNEAQSVVASTSDALERDAGMQQEENGHSIPVFISETVGDGKLASDAEPIGAETKTEKTMEERLVRSITVMNCESKDDMRTASTKKMLGSIVMQAHRRSQQHVPLRTPGRRFNFTSEFLIEHALNPLMCGVILLNSVKLGMELDVAPDWNGWGVIDNIFLGVYVLELFMKLVLMRCQGFVCGPHKYWNLFDTLVVILSAVDWFIHTLHTAPEPTNYLILFRLIRLARFVRILRLFQFRIFKELLTMLSGLLSGLRTLVWAFVLLFFPIYLLGILLTTFIGKEATDQALEQESFGSLGASMFTVFRCTVGDCTFSNGTPVIMALTRKYGEICAITYIMGIMLTEFGLFNLIMATFVDSALATAKKNDIKQTRKRLCDKALASDKAAAMVERLWALGGNPVELFDPEEAIRMNITKEHFDMVIKDGQVQAILEELDIPESDRLELFDVLDADGGGTLTLEELVCGILSLRGDPRRSDVIQVALVIRSIQDEFKRFRNSTEHRSVQLDKTLADVQRSLDKCLPREAASVRPKRRSGLNSS